MSGCDRCGSGLVCPHCAGRIRFEEPGESITISEGRLRELVRAEATVGIAHANTARAEDEIATLRAQVSALTAERDDAVAGRTIHADREAKLRAELAEITTVAGAARAQWEFACKLADKAEAELAQERARAGPAMALASAYVTWKRQRRHLDQDSSCSKDVCATCDVLALAEDAYARGGR